MRGPRLVSGGCAVAIDQRVIPAVEFEERHLTPEQRLFRAVIWACWSDAFERSDTDLRNSDRGSDPGEARREARRWLTLDFGDWQADRQTVCDLADVSESLLRRAAKERLALAKLDDAEREAEANSRARARVDEMFARLLASADGLHPGRLEQRLRKIAEIEAETV